MSNTPQDGRSEQNEIHMPSTSSTSKVLQQNYSPSMDLMKMAVSTSSNSTSPALLVQNQPQGKTHCLVFTNSSLSDVTTQCQDMHLNNNLNSEENGSKPGSSKRKNAKKKERLKHIKIPNGNENILMSGLSSTVQDFFMNQVSPMYAPTSTRYLENLSYHPQYQFLGSPVQYASSVPSSPFIPRVIPSGSVSVSNSPAVLIESSSPRYVQNALQHPLLSQSLSVDRQQGRVRQPNVAKKIVVLQNTASNSEEKVKGSPRHRRKNKKKEKNEDDKKFEPYLSAEEVELGLKNNIFFEGVLRINPKQFQHSYLSSSDRSEQDILIDGIRNRNRALEGDIVVVQMINDSENEESEVKNDENDKIVAENNKQKKGKVIFIKEKVHTRRCIGNLKLMPDKNRQRALFVPRDHRIPRLNIPFTSWPDDFYKESKNYESTLFVAKIMDWFDIRFAIGTIVCQIGQSGDMKSESLAILVQNDLDITPFGSDVRDLFPRLDYVIPEEEIKIRQDCRSLCTFSIDPSNCRDIDDAVSCQELENGNFEIGVHISDVAHYLTENTILDEKVAEKATTIYMVERAYHMLPDELCMLCSLFPGVDKLAFSVFWEITKDAQVIKKRISKTVINSCCQLAYDHAQAILEDKDNAEDIFPETYNGFLYEDIYKSIKVLGNISAILRKKRFDSGALRIDQPKVSFHLSTQNGLPESFWIYESKESHQLIEEFMLLANMTVAERIYEDHPSLAFLRCHPPPSAFMLKQLAKSLKPMDIELDISSAGDLHRSLLPHVGPECTNKGKAMVLNMLCAKPMTRAKYFCAAGRDDDEFHHYALNVPLYTHFTSPIRRYADIMVHRLLAASLKYREVPKWDVDKVQMIAAQCNKQKYNAKRAGEMSTELYTLKYIEMHSPVVTEAVVVEVREKYIDIIIVAMGLNRRLFFNNDFPGEYKCIKSDAGTKLSKMELTWRATDETALKTQVIEVFSILNVEMFRDEDMMRVETRLVRPM